MKTRLASSFVAGCLAFASAAFAAEPFTPFLPAARPATGAGVLILSPSDSDGAQIARWLNERGIAAFVARAGASADDARQALQSVRAKASEHRISPRRVAVLGLGLGATAAAQLGYAAEASERPALLALVDGGPASATLSADVPPTLLIGSTAAAGTTDSIELWNKLRAARAPVDAHFFSQPHAVGQVSDLPRPGQSSDLLSWQEMFYVWARFHGLLTEQPRVAIKGMVQLDGYPLPHGYVILTPVDFVGAGPIVARVFNSTANVPIGEFVVPANQGPIAGRYKIDVRQNMNRWLSNSFSGGLIGGGRGGGQVTPEQAHFGHHRVLAPSIDDQKSFTKVRPTDKDDYIIEIKPGADANLALKIEVFSGAPAKAALSAGEAIGGIVGGPKNAGQAAYVDQIKRGAAGKVAGIPEPILLWPNGAPQAVPDANGVFTDEDKPALYAFPAPAANNTGAAILILPGGGFTNRVMDSEGVQIAKFLNRHGIAGFVLRYRIGPNYSRAVSTLDAQRAMRHIRANAAQFQVTPDRIGVIGFSAGGTLQCDAFYNNVSEGEGKSADPIERGSARANFGVLIYGSRALQNPAGAPPTFMFATLEDQGGSRGLIEVMHAMRAVQVPVEAHFYQAGPHGTTMSPGDPLLGQWPGLMIRWLKASDMIKDGAKAAKLR